MASHPIALTAANHAPTLIWRLVMAMLFLAALGWLIHTHPLPQPRPVRLTLDSQQGVSVVRDEELHASAGAVVFDILRPAWQVELKTQVLLNAVCPT